MGQTVLEIIPEAGLQTFPVRAHDGTFPHISRFVIGILRPSVDAALFVKDSLFGQAAICIILPADLKTLGGNDFRQVAVRIIAVPCNGGLHLTIALNLLRLLCPPTVFVVSITDNAPDSLCNDPFLKDHVAQTVIVIAKLCPEIVLYRGKVVVRVVGKVEPVPALGLRILFRLLLSVSLLHLVSLTVIAIGNGTIERAVFSPTDADLLPDLPAQAIVDGKGFFPFAIHLPKNLPMSIVLVGMKNISLRILYHGQTPHGVIGITIALTIIKGGIVGFRLYLLYQVSIHIVETPFHSAIRVTDADAVTVRIILVTGSFARFPLKGITYRMNPVNDVSIKVPEYTLMLLQGGYCVHDPLKEVIAVLIAAFLILPLDRRIVSRQIPHAVIELMLCVALPVSPFRNKVSGIIGKLHRSISISDGHSAAYFVITIDRLLTLWRNDTAWVFMIGIILPDSLVSQSILLQNTSSPEIILLGNLLPFPVSYLFPGQDLIMGIIIDIDALPSIAVPGMY